MDKPIRVINMEHIPLLKEPKETTENAKLFAIIVMPSMPSHFEERSAIRESVFNNQAVRKMISLVGPIKLLFAIGTSKSFNHENKLQQEAQEFQGITIYLLIGFNLIRTYSYAYFQIFCKWMSEKTTDTFRTRFCQRSSG